jgi:catechol 2,3-dioxygenase-like lactoylglutathione lyase family enzyme
MDGPEFSAEHIGLPARDTATLANWYVRVLGGRVVFDNGQRPPALFVELPGGLVVEFYPAASSLSAVSDNALAGWRHVALRVAAIEPAQRALESRGVQFADPPKPAGGGGRVLFFKDPEGNLLHLVERPSGSVFGEVG